MLVINYVLRILNGTPHCWLCRYSKMVHRGRSLLSTIIALLLCAIPCTFSVPRLVSMFISGWSLRSESSWVLHRRARWSTAIDHRSQLDTGHLSTYERQQHGSWPTAMWPAVTSDRSSLTGGRVGSGRAGDGVRATYLLCQQMKPARQTRIAQLRSASSRLYFRCHDSCACSVGLGD